MLTYFGKGVVSLLVAFAILLPLTIAAIDWYRVSEDRPIVNRHERERSYERYDPERDYLLIKWPFSPFVMLVSAGCSIFMFIISFSHFNQATIDWCLTHQGQEKMKKVVPYVCGLLGAGCLYNWSAISGYLPQLSEWHLSWPLAPIGAVAGGGVRKIRVLRAICLHRIPLRDEPSDRQPRAAARTVA